MNEHRVVLNFDGAWVPSAKLIHPEKCQPADYDPDGGCWVQGYFDNLDIDELLRGEVTVTVEPEWDEVARLHIVKGDEAA